MQRRALFESLDPHPRPLSASSPLPHSMPIGAFELQKTDVDWQVRALIPPFHLGAALPPVHSVSKQAMCIVEMRLVGGEGIRTTTATTHTHTHTHTYTPSHHHTITHTHTHTP